MKQENMDTTRNEMERRDGKEVSRDVNMSTTEYCKKLQEWMWQYYCGYANWQSWMLMSALPFPPCFPLQSGSQHATDSSAPLIPTSSDLASWYNQLTAPPQSNATPNANAGSLSPSTPAAAGPVPAQPNGNAPGQQGGSQLAS